MAGLSAVDQAAANGFDNAAAYDAHRPSYPVQAFNGLLESVGLAGVSGSKVVDLAAGTGKLTEMLAARGEGFEVVAVEPVSNMRQTLAAKELPRVTVRDGLATGMGVEDGWADAVIAAQSFHWFAHEEALAEIRRVLKPGGKLGIIWNIEDYNQPPTWTSFTQWEKQLNDMICNLEPDGPPRFRDEKWWHVFDRQSRDPAPMFSTPIGEAKVPFEGWLTKDGLWERVKTLSQVATLSEEGGEAFKKRFDEVLGNGDGKWNSGEVEFHGTTVYAWTARL
ncbi:hypothetical protein HIM_04021 [Hirsutella minnesotensis 3608]|uniref:Methyltransferase type 11 domain-containing protein n=1 Tax=Hirsutella minnesotensis 3608 TaxID=1043627 RepID=A0A0F7ZQ60_9HYPO|nr:hypothetical protein HIM_04021 [Hirsutella minnesotensis 3608]